MANMYVSLYQLTIEKTT